MRLTALRAAAALSLLAVPAFAQERLSDPELDAHRGGFVVAGDLTFQFGAVVRTFEDGALLQATEVRWTPDGPVLSNPGGGAPSPSGATVVQSLRGGELSNILLNTQSGRSFRLETDVTLVLPGFTATQGDITRSLSALRLADDLANGAISATR